MATAFQTNFVQTNAFQTLAGESIVKNLSDSLGVSEISLKELSLSRQDLANILEKFSLDRKISFENSANISEALSKISLKSLFDFLGVGERILLCFHNPLENLEIDIEITETGEYRKHVRKLMEG